MTKNQMELALEQVGACFAITSAKCILPSDGYDSKPSYHIHPEASYPHEQDMVRVYSHKQFADWIRTAKAAIKTDQEQAYLLWQAYEYRWIEA